ncbi:MAG TPA: hypothetical protein VMW43_08135 [Bacteroidota bacterium]|nr:hypothetical protein [Bacteroidota bacterium]
MTGSFARSAGIVLLFLLLGDRSVLNAQGTAGSGALLETRSLVDIPTAGMLPHGDFALGMEFFQEGGMLFSGSFGVTDHFMLGLSYGGTGLLGDAHPQWNPAPGVLFRVRIFDETISLPALVLGFESQGKEPYVTDPGRYTIKSPGFYLVVSKNYEAYGTLSFHGGVNYSLEHADGDKDPDLFAGAEKSVGRFLSFLAEYNLGWDDSDRGARGRGRGYLNLALAVSAGNGLTLRFSLKDLLHNQPQVTAGNRVFSVDFVNPI